MLPWLAEHRAHLAACWTASALLGLALGWQRAQARRGLALALLLGPLGPVALLLTGPALTRCPACARLTPWYPRPDVGPGGSYPHLRCRRCGAYVD